MEVNPLGQSECIKVLERSDWISTVDIAKQLNQHNGVVARSLRILYENDEILRRGVHGNNKIGYEWKILK